MAEQPSPQLKDRTLESFDKKSIPFCVKHSHMRPSFWADSTNNAFELLSLWRKTLVLKPSPFSHSAPTDEQAEK